MSRYLLDTPLVAAYLLGRPTVQALVNPWLIRREAATSIIVYGEVVEYLLGRSGFRERQQQLLRLLQDVAPLFPTYSVLDRYAVLRRSMRPPFGAGLIGDIDTLIAATALEQNLMIVTTDRDFTRVPGLGVLLLDRATLTVAKEPNS